MLCGVGLAAGGFTLVAMVHIFNIERYKPILRPAILTAFLGYTLVVVACCSTWAGPDRLWHPLVMWNPHSVMFEVAWCVTLYTTVLFLEFLPVVFEKFGWHKPLEWIHKHLGAADDPGRAAFHAAPDLAGHAVPDRAGEAVSALVHARSCRCCFTFRRSRGAGHDDFRIVAQQPGVRPRAGTAAAGEHGARAGGAAERLPVDPLPGSEPRGVLRRCCAQNRIETWLFVLEIALLAVPTVLLFQRRVRCEPGRAVRLRGDGGVRLHRQPAERGHHRPGSRLGHALHPAWSEVAVTLSIVAAGLRHLPRDRAIFPHFRGAVASRASARAEVEETEADPVPVRHEASAATNSALGLAAKLAICVIASTAAFLLCSATSTCGSSSGATPRTW